MRAVSTAVDAVVFLLLVSAAATTLTVAPLEPPAQGTAAPTAGALVATTTTVTYTPIGAAHSRDVRTTPARLLAQSAVVSATLDGARLDPAGRPLSRAARNPVAAIAAHRSHRVQTVAVWRPFPGADLGGRVTVGPTPPRDADVAATVVHVPSGLPRVDAAVTRAATAGGFDAVARVVASGIVDGLFPPNRSRVALYTEGPTSDRAVRRYRNAATVLDVDVAQPIREGDTEVANRRLRRALTAALAEDLRDRFSDPEAAATAVRVGEVRVVVRTWSA